MTIERDVEETLVRAVKRAGGWALKFTSPGTAGVPDRIVLLPHGRIFFAELKRPGETPRPLQVRIMEKLKALGFKVYVIDNKEQAKEVVEHELQAP